MHDHALQHIAARFDLPGPVTAIGAHGSGWIHATYAVTCDAGGRPLRFVLQRVNRSVFRDPVAVMQNVARVTAHQRAALERAGAKEPERRALSLVPAQGGEDFVRDEDGELWRVYRFIEGASSHDVARSEADVRAAAEAFGRFVAQLSDLPGPRLHDTIPRFHDARMRFEALRDAARRDPAGRLAGARAELALVLEREADVDRLAGLRARGVLHERVVHNDTKLNNVLLDDRTGEGLCVIDLDTVMPGLVAYDFGDLVRTAACRAPEDERDLRRVQVDPGLFRAIAEGYLAGAGGLLSEDERATLASAGHFMTLVVGIRFLTDHLEGDRYFRIQRPGQNLDRARAQLALVRSLEHERARLEDLVARAVEVYAGAGE